MVANLIENYKRPDIPYAAKYMDDLKQINSENEKIKEEAIERIRTEPAPDDTPTDPTTLSMYKGSCGIALGISKYVDLLRLEGFE